jgi:lipoyl(octanoyl) transferase
MTRSASQNSPVAPAASTTAPATRPDIITPDMITSGPDGITIWQNHAPLAYDAAIATMESHIAAMQAGNAPEVLWFLEHQPVYTGGSSAKDNELLLPHPDQPDQPETDQPDQDQNLQGQSPQDQNLQYQGQPIIRATGRGGQWTYHAPGQRIVYIMLDLNRRGRDIHAFVRGIEAWGIAALAQCGITGTRRNGAPGIWVDTPHHTASPSQPNDKIAAIGIRLSRWISWHGIAINVNATMLDGFRHIIPCGISDAGVTACDQIINQPADIIMRELDQALIHQFSNTLGRYTDADISNINISQN